MKQASIKSKLHKGKKALTRAGQEAKYGLKDKLKGKKAGAALRGTVGAVGGALTGKKVSELKGDTTDSARNKTIGGSTLIGGALGVAGAHKPAIGAAKGVQSVGRKLGM